MDTSGNRELLTAYKESGLLVFKSIQDGALLPVVNAPKYRRFCGAIAWLEPTLPGDWAQNWLPVVGEREDGIYSAIEEWCGDLPTLAAAAISSKDRLFMQQIWVDDDEKTTVRSLRNPKIYDGLCAYDQAGSNFGIPQFTHDGHFWPTYRDRHTIAALLPVPTDVKPTTLSNYEQLRQLASVGRFKKRDDTGRIAWLLRQEPPLDKVLLHPLLKALCWLLTMMERTRVVPTTQQQPVPDVWYGNPR